MDLWVYFQGGHCRPGQRRPTHYALPSHDALRQLWCRVPYMTALQGTSHIGETNYVLFQD